MSEPRPAVPPGRYPARLATAAELLRERGIAAGLVGVGADLRWLAGYAAPALERLTLLVLPAEGEPTLVAPRLEAVGARASPVVAAGAAGLRTWEENEDPFALVAAVLPSAARSGRLLVNDQLWAGFLLRLQEALPAARFGSAAPVMRQLRIVKDADELALLRLAAHAADRTVLGIAGTRLVGRTEADVAREVRDRLVAEGHDEAAFWIVGSGPHSAEPHHDVSDRLIVAGEPIVLDIGGILGGYYSDTTRTLWTTGGDPARGPDATFRRLYAVLQEAQAAARAAVRPGVACEALDAVARERIGAAGFGDAFTHRTGHGIGLDVHEEPYVVRGNGEKLRPAMTFSIEPGIYLEGRYGARIEDIVACGPAGPDELNVSSRDVYVVSGV